MWLASASLHCEMQLNSPGAINGLLIQTRPGGGAAPSPTVCCGFFRLDDWTAEGRKGSAEHEQPRNRHRVEWLKHGIVSNRHAKARAGLFSLPFNLLQPC
jgi:hypothetical protein